MLAFLYAGQGAQRPGMGRDIYEAVPEFKAVIDEAEGYVKKYAGFDLKKVMFEGTEEELGRTSITQPVLAAFGAGISAILAGRKIVPAYTAGLSLGEYTALYESGVFDLKTLIKITSFRGKAMEEAGKGLDTKMCAVIGLGADETEAICKKASEETGQSVEVSNYNAKGQNVISGLSQAVIRAEELAKAAGAKRCMELKVSSAFHTGFMKPASEKLADFLPGEKFGDMKVPVVFNTLGTTVCDTPDKAAVTGLLTKQVMSSVRMAQSLEFLAEKGVTDIIEVGPGHVLAGFVKRTVSGITCKSLDTLSDIECIAEL